MLLNLGLAACPLKANTGKLERKACIVQEVSNLGRRWMHIQKPTPSCQPGSKSYSRGVSVVEGGHYMQNSSQLRQSSWNWSCSGLISVFLIILGTVNLQLQGQFVPISLSLLLKMVQNGASYVTGTVWAPCRGCRVGHRLSEGFAQLQCHPRSSGELWHGHGIAVKLERNG